MTAYSALQHQKFKSWGAIAGLQGHIDRTIPCPNADPNLTQNNLELLELPDDERGLPWEVITRLRIGNQTIRKNAVLVCGIVLNVSPEFFRPENPKEPYTYDLDRVEKWAKICREWLLEKYGKNRLLSITLHLDEATPHIHVAYVPFDEKGKLNARGFIGANRSAMSNLQTEYANAIAHLGIERGLKRSKAIYTDIKKNYANLPKLSNLTDFESELTAQKLQQERDRAELERQRAELENLSRQLHKQLHQQQQKTWAEDIAGWGSLMLLEAGKNYLKSQRGDYEVIRNPKNQFLQIRHEGTTIATKQGENPAEPGKELTAKHHQEFGDRYRAILSYKARSLKARSLQKQTGR